ncbi:hypothetical protein KFL_000550355 [Klebsormidium nitens]|uniref:Glycosyl hydrolase family 13 catalytic domain-containing protein n=1 Tax=Klebsormidium nitens TaxID=105231 RepID=A0A1Y1HVF0_KLENI|nr:hypothetical protein KFL_000550355 [Klebsormidium nitens]|eukprot:GAQ80506.1 hypothetical protein KFL_000550355 [Klebsormidium nitens]
MSRLGERFWQYKTAFADGDALGTFLDNHDQDRFFQYVPGGDLQLAKSALTYLLLSQGIPIGTLLPLHTSLSLFWFFFALTGTNDQSRNRKPLWWIGFDTSAPLYKFIAFVNKIRGTYRVWRYPQKEGWSGDDLYVFTRGPVLVALTNRRAPNPQTLPGTSHNFRPGERVCNLFFPSADCETVGADGTLRIVLLNGEQKIFVPKRTLRTVGLDERVSDG